MSTQVHLTIRQAASEPTVTVIVPLSLGEPQPDALLEALPPEFEVIMARGGTRATSMNHAAAAARGRHLWFVHADTGRDGAAGGSLQAALAREPAALHFFDIRFDGGLMMRLTDLGVRFRARRLGLPFGDQALCLPAESFARLGGFPEDVRYGEDHLLVWRAHREGVPVLPAGATVSTSARKYARHGWARTTRMHLWLTLRQAWPEWRAYRRALGDRRRRLACDEAVGDGREKPVPRKVAGRVRTGDA
ncbi:MAG: hypothetical protein ACRCTI_15530 [Beijerinckiaceae bacterium]